MLTIILIIIKIKMIMKTITTTVSIFTAFEKIYMSKTQAMGNQGLQIDSLVSQHLWNHLCVNKIYINKTTVMQWVYSVPAN